MIICPICNKQYKQITNAHLKNHNITTSEFKKQFPKNPLVSFEIQQKNKQNSTKGKLLSKMAQQANLENRIAKYSEDPAFCKQCHTNLSYKNRHNQFCSQSCSGVYTNQHRDYVMSTETKQRISTKMKQLDTNPRKNYKIKHGTDYDYSAPTCRRPKLPRKNVNCLKCGIMFECRINESRKYCSITCRRACLGGYHPNSTRVHRCVYKETQLDSGAELVFVKLLDTHNIQWVKNHSTYFNFTNRQNKQQKYYPDFFLPQQNLWVEIKGKRYLREDDDLRLASVGNIIRIMSHDLKKTSYVINIIKSAVHERHDLSLDD